MTTTIILLITAVVSVLCFFGPMKRGVRRIINATGIILLAFCIACRLFTPVADFYAERLYPAVSGGLSWLASFTRFSLEELVVTAFILAFVITLARAIRKHEKFLSWLGKTLVLLMWLLVWFYMGWGNNYSRTGLYARNGIQRVSYDADLFCRFLDEYTSALNLSAAEAGEYDRDELEKEVKDYYSESVSPYGYTELRRWQHVKKPLFNPLFSAVTVHGYMGPFFCETQLNTDLPELDYPYVLAHEMAHLAGVTSEAEASWWGYDFCRRSGNAAVRYSGYLAVFPYVFVNARGLLPEEEFASWLERICEKAKIDYTVSSEFWSAKRIGWIDNLQRAMLELFLKSNGIAEGTKDYSGVVGMIMTMDSSPDTRRCP